MEYEFLIRPKKCSDAGTIADAAASPIDQAEEIDLVFLRAVITVPSKYCCFIETPLLFGRRIRIDMRGGIAARAPHRRTLFLSKQMEFRLCHPYDDANWLP